MPSFVHTAESGGHNKPMRKRANGKFQERIKQDHSNVTEKNIIMRLKIHVRMKFAKRIPVPISTD